MNRYATRYTALRRNARGARPGRVVFRGLVGFGRLGIDASTDFANVRDDPRWLPFLRSIGKAPEQLDAIPFPVTLPP